MKAETILLPDGSRVARQLTHAGFTLTETVYPSRLQMANHTHDLASFSFVLSGTYTETLARRTQRRAPSNLIFHPPGESHSVGFHQTRACIFNLQVEDARLRKLREHAPVLDRPLIIEEGESVWLARRLYREFSLRDAAYALSVEGLALEVLAESARDSFMERQASEPPAWMKRVEEMLRAEFREHISLNYLAKCAGVHPVHLARTFRRHHNCTVGDYVRRLRVRLAARQLQTTEAPLREIALAAGFADQSHLSRIFKRYTGLTPSDYRKARSH